MKKLTSILIFLALTIGALSSNFASAITTEQVYLLNKKMGPVANKVQLGTLVETASAVPAAASITEAQLAATTADGYHAKRYAVVTFNTSTGTNSVAGTHTLAVTIPAYSSITDAYMVHVGSPLTSAGTSTISFGCGNSNGLVSTVNVSTLATSRQGTPAAGDASTYAGGGSACSISATVVGDNLISGLVKLIVSYNTLM